MKILIADDDKNFGAVLKSELEEEKYKVDVVGDGVEAVLMFMTNPYDLVMLDLIMPRLNGIDTLRIMKRFNPDVHVITFSGRAGDVEVAESLNRGALKSLRKPFEIGQLKELIRNGVLMKTTQRQPKDGAQER